MEPLEIGDIIETDVQNPHPRTLRFILATQAALDYGRKLVASGRWRKGKTIEQLSQQAGQQH